MNLLLEHFLLDAAPDLSPRFNIAPTQQVPVVRLGSENAGRQMTTMRWGLVPSWAKDPSIGNRMINARGETVAEKPSFRSAFKKRRGLVVADGYFEWEKRGKQKVPHYIRMKDERPFAFAGLWERWGSRDDPLLTCTIITTESNELTRPLHERMPVILDEADYDMWLDPELQDRESLEQLLQPYDSAEMAVDQVSTHVNSVKNDDPQCLAIQRELF